MQSPGCTEYRGIPLIDVDKLLSFVNVSEDPGADKEIQFDVPVEMGSLAGVYAVVSVESQAVQGVSPVCQDLSIVMSGVEASRAYQIIVGDSTNEDLATFYYAPSQRSGGKHSRPSERMDYRALKALRR